MNVNEIVPVTIGLSATPASQASFSTAILMVDHADVPIDKRYRITTKSSFATDLTAATAQLNWCTELWSQNYNPSVVYIGRYSATATIPHFIFPQAVDVAATYAALLDTASFKLVEGAADEQIDPNFTGDTTMTDVCASIQVGLAASVLGAAYTCSLDVYDRVVVWSDLSGSGADSVSAATPAARIDLTLAIYLGSSFSVDGIDAETAAAALTIILNQDNTPYIICEAGLSMAQQLAFSTAVNAMDKIYILRTVEEDVKNGALSTDVGYTIHALLHQRTHLTYTEHITHYPDAAICGEIFPRKEATTNLALTPLLGLSESGLDIDGTTVIPLTVGERTALDAKGVDYLVNPAGQVHLVNGTASGGNEIRIMVGKDFCAAKISEAVYGYMLASNVVTFSDEDIMAIKGIIVYWLEEMVDRKVLEADYEITMPEAADFTAAMKATHQMDLTDLGYLDAQISVNVVNISLNWNV